MSACSLRCLAYFCSNDCRVSDAQIVNGNLYIADYYGNAAKIIDLKTQKVMESVKTDAASRFIHDVHCLGEARVMGKL